jgi:hypothetical protein
MSDPNWNTLASLAVTVLPAVVRFRAEISRALDMVAEFVGLVVMIFGVFIYGTTLPQLQRMQGDLARISAESQLLAAQQVQTLYTLYTGSIAMMVLGGFLAISGLLGRVAAGLKRVGPPKRK